MNLELPAEHLEVLEALLARHVPGAEVWAYGSRVTGSSHEGSDLDLVVRQAKAIPSRTLMQLSAALRDSSLPFQVEVRDWRSLPTEFLAEIEREHAVIQRPAS